MDKLLRIGDVARLFHLSVSSLRHYEDEGLLVPEKIDPDTGYRYYNVRQFEVLNTIRYLRALDMPLSEIGDFLKNRDVEKIEEKLLRQKRAVAEKRRELLRIERRIDNRLARLREAQDARLGEILLRDAPACRVVWLQKELRLNSFLDMEGAIRCLDECQSETAIFLGKVGASMSVGRAPEKRGVRSVRWHFSGAGRRGSIRRRDDPAARNALRDGALSGQSSRGARAVRPADGLCSDAWPGARGLFARNYADRLRPHQ